MGYKELMRMKLLEQMYDNMSDEEKRTFVQLTMQNKSHDEIMQALNRQQEQIGFVADKVKKQNWLTYFGSEIAANFLTDGLIYLGSRLLRR